MYLACMFSSTHFTLSARAPADGEPPTTPRGKIAALYAAFMDAGRIEALGASPLKAELAYGSISTIESKRVLQLSVLRFAILKLIDDFVRIFVASARFPSIVRSVFAAPSSP